MNPKPTSSMQRATASGVRSMRAPSASSTSAEPDRPVAERLPCLATAQPAPAATRAAVVETLNPRGPRAHRLGQPGDLVDRLALRAQGDEERGDLRLAGVAGHDLGQDGARLL